MLFGAAPFSAVSISSLFWTITVTAAPQLSVAQQASVVVGAGGVAFGY